MVYLCVLKMQFLACRNEEHCFTNEIKIGPIESTLIESGVERSRVLLSSYTGANVPLKSVVMPILKKYENSTFSFEDKLQAYKQAAADFVKACDDHPPQIS